MVNVGNYVAVKYENSWWISNILEATTPEDELLVKFTHSNRPWKTFYWPKHDILLVPKADVLLKISKPSISRSCVYQLTDEEFIFLLVKKSLGIMATKLEPVSK